MYRILKNKKCSLDMQTFLDVSALKMMQIKKKLIEDEMEHKKDT